MAFVNFLWFNNTMVAWFGVFAVLVLTVGIMIVLGRYGIDSRLTLSDHVAAGPAHILFRVYGLAYSSFFLIWLMYWQGLPLAVKALLLTGIASFILGLFIPRVGRYVLPHDLTANVAGTALVIALALLGLRYTDGVLSYALAVLVIGLITIGATLLKRLSAYYLYRQLAFYLAAHIGLLAAFFLL